MSVAPFVVFRRVMFVYLAVCTGVVLGYVGGVLFAPATTLRAALVNRAGLALLGGFLGWYSASVSTPSGPIQWSKEVQPIQGRAAYEALLEKSKTAPVILEFYADWCAPCRAGAPELDQLAKTGQLVAVANGETNLALMQVLGVTAYPTTLILRDGKEAHRSMGYKTVEELRELLR